MRVSRGSQDRPASAEIGRTVVRGYGDCLIPLTALGWSSRWDKDPRPLSGRRGPPCRAPGCVTRTRNQGTCKQRHCLTGSRTRRTEQAPVHSSNRGRSRVDSSSAAIALLCTQLGSLRIHRTEGGRLAASSSRASTCSRRVRSLSRGPTGLHGVCSCRSREPAGRADSGNGKSRSV